MLADQTTYKFPCSAPMISHSLTTKMEYSTFPTPAISIFFYFIFLSVFCFSFSNSADPGIETDKLALLAFKSLVSDDPHGVLNSWNESIHFCQWHGIICSRQDLRIVAVDLHGQNLTGTISPYLGNLTFLRGISLEGNSFHGNIPREIGRLSRLEVLMFSQNSLEGEIPITLSNCTELEILDLVMNRLEGNIPDELGKLSKLDTLGLAINNLTGPIPQSFSNLSLLNQLSLSENRLSGEIPVGLGQLRLLRRFQISANMFFTGSIPIQLFNISSMEYFGVTGNQLIGEIPPYIGFTLPNLRVLLMGGNRFTGQIPNSICNASRLERIEISSNFFTGSIPVDLGRLENLTRFNVAKNNLGFGKGDDLSFLNSLANCTRLEVLSLSYNNLSGVLPDVISNFSSGLYYFYIGQNRISGIIPTGIGNLRSLILLAMENNSLTGSIPSSFGNLRNLQELALFGNRISGEIPSSIGNLTFLAELTLNENSIRGNIPSTLGNCRHLQILDLAMNNLSGTIPVEVIGLTSLSQRLDLSWNSLTGSLSPQVGNLRSIGQLDLSHNNLSGEIPSSLANCIALEHLNLNDNSFYGTIPLSLRSLRGLQELDLSHNNFSGEIPDLLQTLALLLRLNLSFNEFEGEMPKEGIFKNASAFSITGNDNLCGGIPDLHLDGCPSSKAKKKFQQTLAFKIIIITISLITCLLLVTCVMILICRRRKRQGPGLGEFIIEDKYQKVSYAELQKATDGFSSDNLIGIGGYGLVYEGILGNENSKIAVKVLNSNQHGASKSFIAECEALRCIRHRNLVKIITSCSSVDFQGNEFKALVYEFMPKGSLDKWLYQNTDDGDLRARLNIMQRLSIAIDVANALDYLHHHSHTCVVHCDLKPSNVLLDDNMVAHVGDFGLARLLVDNPQDQTISSALKGSTGYIAPEYAVTGKVSTHGDVYSFGVLLLEMFLGKKPTDDMFMEEGLNIHSFAKVAIPDGVYEIIDKTMLEDEETLEVEDCCDEKFQPTFERQIQEILVSILRVGVQCSVESPKQRMQLREVITELEELRKMIQVIKL